MSTTAIIVSIAIAGIVGLIVGVILGADWSKSEGDQ